MKIYSVAQAKTSLSKLLKDVGSGQEVTITDHNRPVAKVISMNGTMPLPEIDLKKLLKTIPVHLAPGAPSSSDLVRQIREED